MALLVATAVHAGFQLTVSCVVYPALAAVPASLWSRSHDQHSRRITPLVGVLYLGVVTAVVGALATDPAAWTWVAAAATVLALGLTAAAAVPLHRRLAGGHDPALVGRLLVVDRLRTTSAVAALVAAVAGALG